MRPESAHAMEVPDSILRTDSDPIQALVIMLPGAEKSTALPKKE